jgi:integrase
MGGSGRTSPFWMARFIGPEGRLIEKTTKHTDRKKAQAAAETLERAARQARAGELTQAAILKSMADLLERTTGEKLNLAPVKDFFTEWLNSKATVGRAGSTVKRYRPILNGFLASIGEKRARASIGSVTPAEVERFRDAQLAEGKGKNTSDMAVKVLRAVFNAARRRGIAPSNPAEAVELLQADAEERHPFTADQTRALLRAARGTDWHGMILCAWNTGIRLSDAANLTWANIDLQVEILTFREGKTAARKRGKAKDTVVCLHRDLSAWLLSLPAGDRPDAPLFPTLLGKPSGSHGGLSNAFSRLMDKARIRQPATGASERTGKGRTFRALGFHSFRHAFISRLANADVPADVRKSLAGHSSDEVHRRYVHLDVSTQRRAIDGLPSLNA